VLGCFFWNLWGEVEKNIAEPSTEYGSEYWTTVKRNEERNKERGGGLRE
jgi:hypothetical protein